MAEAEDVLPKRRNHGLNPSEDLAEMIRQCWGDPDSVRLSFLDAEAGAPGVGRIS